MLTVSTDEGPDDVRDTLKVALGRRDPPFPVFRPRVQGRRRTGTARTSSPRRGSSIRKASSARASTARATGRQPSRSRSARWSSAPAAARSSSSRAQPRGNSPACATILTGAGARARRARVPALACSRVAKTVRYSLLTPRPTSPERTAPGRDGTRRIGRAAIAAAAGAARGRRRRDRRVVPRHHPARRPGRRPRSTWPTGRARWTSSALELGRSKSNIFANLRGLEAAGHHRAAARGGRAARLVHAARQVPGRDHRRLHRAPAPRGPRQAALSRRALGAARRRRRAPRPTRCARGSATCRASTTSSPS